MTRRSLKELSFIVLFACFQTLAHAQVQVDTTVMIPNSDTAKSSFVTRMQKLGREETINSIEKYRLGRIAIKQKFLLEEIKSTVQKAKIYLRKGIDSASILGALKSSNEALALVKEGVFVNTGTIQTQRNLAVSAAILSELLVKMREQQNDVADYNDDLVDFRDRLDSLSTDSALYSFSPDSLTTLRYVQKIAVVVKDLAPTDSIINRSLSYIQDLQTRVDMMVYTLHSSLEDVERYRNAVTEKVLSRELGYINEPKTNSRPLSEIIDFSIAKEKLALDFYIKDNIGRTIILAVLIVLSTLFIRSLKHKLREENSLDADFKGQLVLRYPFISAIFLTINIFQFIYLDPPFISAFFLWLIAAICLTIIFNKVVDKHWLWFWQIMIVLFIIGGLDNMVLQVSRTERWIMLALSFFGSAYGGYLLLNSRKYELKERGLLYFIAFVLVMEITSMICNIFGRFNISKTLLVSGFSGMIIAVLFIWTARLLNETLALTSRVYKHPDRRLFYINFEKIGDRVPPLFYIFLVIGWLILVGRNFYSFKQMASRLNEFLTNERTLGDYTFSINGLFVFFLILACSVLLSKIISFFAEPAESRQKNVKTKRVGLGSWLLLIRIFIITVGLFLAFAASGIPLDRITIIVGALGVGIGLGLQSLVNNLVSGLIIAFEKPINVGDNIEVNNKAGVMKSIGFRSSVVVLSDGACLIIPNGDLLSQQLVNWTMGRNIKRLNISVGVAYDTDLQKTQQILNKILAEEDRIKNWPPPVVAPHKFGMSAIEIQLQFWVANMGEATMLTGDIITRINTAFKEAGIVIPLPQQELLIRPESNSNETDPINPLTNKK